MSNHDDSQGPYIIPLDIFKGLQTGLSRDTQLLAQLHNTGAANDYDASNIAQLALADAAKQYPGRTIAAILTQSGVDGEGKAVIVDPQTHSVTVMGIIEKDIKGEPFIAGDSQNATSYGQVNGAMKKLNNADPSAILDALDAVKTLQEVNAKMAAGPSIPISMQRDFPAMTKPAATKEI